jgi:hypothetical protein
MVTKSHLVGRLLIDFLAKFLRSSLFFHQKYCHHNGESDGLRNIDFCAELTQIFVRKYLIVSISSSSGLFVCILIPGQYLIPLNGEY